MIPWLQKTLTGEDAYQIDEGGQAVAFIDIGTNSIRLLLVHVQPNGTYSVINERKETIRLGEGEFETHHLQPVAIERALLVCQRFAEMAESAGAVEMIAVATSATREATNRVEFLRRLYEEASLEVHAISGREEARLIYLGVSRGEHLGDKLGLFVDIGGGSTELIVGDQLQYHFLDTTKLGAIRLASLFPGDEEGRISKQLYKDMQTYVRNSAIRTVQTIHSRWPDGLDHMIGSSGTIENLADIAVRRFHGRSREPDDVLSYDQLQTLVKDLRRLPSEERKDVPGINRSRADIIVPGAAILDTLMRDLGFDQIRVSLRSLRDGLLVDYMARYGLLEDRADSSIREQSVLRLGRSQQFDEQHAQKVTELALQLFDTSRAAGLHDLGRWERELLGHAAMLHDIGVSLSYSDHHTHSYYFIRNADLLGFNQQEVDIIAVTALYHRKSYPRKKHPEFASLDPQSQSIVVVLGALLSMSEGLDRSHMGLVQQVRLIDQPDDVTLLEIRSDQDIPLEVWGVQHHEKAFRRAFGTKLRTLQIWKEK